jgi:hypothetical protein
MCRDADYIEFLRSKHLTAKEVGFEPTLPFNPLMKPFQKAVTAWSIRLGRSAIFAGTGLGKTLCQLEYARHVVDQRNCKALILAPLAVSHQTVSEGEKFGIEVNLCRSDFSARKGINITNYEMMDKFNASEFDCIILDESSLLKSIAGKIKQKIIDTYQYTPYRLACTATPAPNDHMELGNHSEFLSVLPQEEMLTKFFFHDSGKTQSWKLKNNARDQFWKWVCSWAACYDKPSDIGFDDDGYNLPPLNMVQHVVEVDATRDSGGMLFRQAELSATTLSRENRLTLASRVARAAEIATRDKETYVVWCELNDEANALRRAIPDAVEIRGSDSTGKKEETLNAFARGQIRVLITKPKIAGFGLNWQHCHNTIFVGMNYKYEAMYQAIRRFWRFGQIYPVDVHLIMAETEGPVLHAIQRKQANHEAMKREMLAAMREIGGLDGITRNVRLVPYEAEQGLIVPWWLVPRCEDGTTLHGG